MKIKGPWTVGKQTDFTDSFKRIGYAYRYFDLDLESGGDPIDIEFNYKDLAHLKCVHNTFDIFYSHIGEDIVTCVIMQKLFGLNFPLTHVGLQLGENHLFFHDSFLNIMLTSEVITEPLGNHRVNVKTTYGIGAPKWFLPFIFPVLKRLLTRNYHILMEGDKPMRDRRGELRDWGMRFSQKAYAFCETLSLWPQHVFANKEAPVPEAIRIPLSSVTAEATFVGRSDAHGLQLFRRDKTIEIFPRACPHEGSCLDKKTLKLGDKAIACPWHGRMFGPILRIPLEQTRGEFVSPFHRFSLEGDLLTIEPLPVDEDNDTDWTTRARSCESVPEPLQHKA